MRIQIDTREKPQAIGNILAEFDRQCVVTIRSKLPYGDYASPDYPDIVVDRKQNLLELCNNISDVPKKNKDGSFKKDQSGQILTEKRRFISELKGARQFGQKIVILCEHGGQIRSIEDVKEWKNPRLKESPLAISGTRLYIILNQLMKTYGFEIRFCDKRCTGKEIIKILKGE